MGVCGIGGVFSRGPSEATHSWLTAGLCGGWSHTRGNRFGSGDSAGYVPPPLTLLRASRRHVGPRGVGQAAAACLESYLAALETRLTKQFFELSGIFHSTSHRV